MDHGTEPFPVTDAGLDGTIPRQCTGIPGFVGHCLRDRFCERNSRNRKAGRHGEMSKYPPFAQENPEHQKPHYHGQLIDGNNNPGNPMKQEKISDTEKKTPAGRGEGLNQNERSILQKSTDRHDKALRILSKL